MSKNSDDQHILISIMSFLRKVSSDKKIYSYKYKNWTKDYKLPFAVQLSIKTGKSKIESWGHGETEDGAYFKAVMELLERYIAFNFSPILFEQNFLFRKSKRMYVNEIKKKYPSSENFLWTTTSGLALHTSKEKSIDLSTSELIERHALLRAHLEGLKIENLNISPHSKYKIPKSFSLSFYRIYASLSNYVITAKIDTPIGCYFGFGTHKKLSSAIEKSFLELSPKIIHSFEVIKLGTSEKNRGFSLLDASKNFTKSIKKVVIDKDISKKDIYHATFNLQNIFPEIPNIYMTRTISPMLQPMFKGSWTMDNLNPAILAKNIPLPETKHFIGQ